MATFKAYDLAVVFGPHDITFNQTYQLNHQTPGADLYGKPLFDAGINTIALVQKATPYERVSQPLGPCHDVILGVSGELHVESGEQVMTVKPGILAFCPNTATMARKCTVPTRFLSIHLSDCPEWAPLKEDGPYLIEYEFSDLLVPLVSRLLKTRDIPTAEAQAYAAQYSRFIVDLIRRELTRKGTSRLVGRHEVALTELVIKIRQHPKRKWTLADMAEEINVSKRTLGRLFMTAYGISPMELVIKNRINKASELLLTTNLTVEEIAKSLDYTNVSSFSELFLKYTGVRPGKHRREVNDV